MRSQASLFPSLPTELRLKIWKMSLPGPRILEVRYDVRSCQFTPCTTLVTHPEHLTPPNLLTNSESRAVALKHYKRSFPNVLCPAGLWIDFEKDTIYIVGETTFPRSNPLPPLIGDTSEPYSYGPLRSVGSIGSNPQGPEINGIRMLAISVRTWVHMWDTLKWQMSGLKIAIIVANVTSNSRGNYDRSVDLGLDFRIRQVASVKDNITKYFAGLKLHWKWEYDVEVRVVGQRKLLEGREREGFLFN